MAGKQTVLHSAIRRALREGGIDAADKIVVTYVGCEFIAVKIGNSDISLSRDEHLDRAIMKSLNAPA